MTKRQMLLGFAAMSLSLASITTARANMFTNDAQYPVGNPITINILNWGSANGTAATNFGNVFAGLFLIDSQQQGTNLAACVDLQNFISFGSNNNYTYQVWYAYGRAGALAALYNSIDWNDANQAVGFQLALWELVYDSYNNPANDNLSAGNFIVNSSNPSGAIAAAQNFLNQIGANKAPYYYLRSVDDQNPAQDLILVPYVPEPASLLALGVGVAGLALRRRRRA